MISCIHLEKQTKDILKLKSVSNTTIGDVAKHLTFGGGGGCWRIIRVIIIVKLFVIDWHSHTGAHIPKISGGVPNLLGPTFMANQYPNNNHIKIFI